MPLVYAQVTDSTAIELIGYDTEVGELHIRFYNKSQYPEYVWGGVEERVIEGFFTTSSKGQYYHRYLKDNPRYRISPVQGSYSLAAWERGPRGKMNARSRRKGTISGLSDAASKAAEIMLRLK